MSDRPPRILVVDDDQDFIFLTRFLLEREGFEVVAWDGTEILDAVRTSEADLVLLDLFLEGTEHSGLDLARRLETMPPPRPVRVVVSGLDHAETHRALRAAGVTEILLKPLEPSRLVATLRRLLDRRDDRL